MGVGASVVAFLFCGFSPSPQISNRQGAKLSNSLPLSPGHWSLLRITCPADFQRAAVLVLGEAL